MVNRAPHLDTDEARGREPVGDNEDVMQPGRMPSAAPAGAVGPQRTLVHSFISLSLELSAANVASMAGACTRHAAAAGAN